MSISREEAAFLQAIQQQPLDDTPKLVFADWLEDQGDARGELIRGLIELGTLYLNSPAWNTLYTQLQPLIEEHTEFLREIRLFVGSRIRLGTGIKNGKAFCLELEKRGFRVNEWARDMLGQKVFIVATKETEIDLIYLSVADLGFTKHTHYNAICASALNMGLELCPAKVGPQLRLEHSEQPRNEWLVIAMVPILDSDGGLDLFSVGHDGGGRWLSASYGPDVGFNPDDRLVFRLPRK